MQINIIDIGAVGGLDLPWKYHPDKVGRTLSFEPNELPILTGTRLRYDCAVWNFDGEANFYISGENGTGSSLLKQNFDWVRQNFEQIKNEGNIALNNTWFERSSSIRQFSCRVKKLDTILAELYQSLGHKVSFPFLKSDTQSGEAFVLDGAQKYLEEDCLALELELYRYPLYEGMILEDEVKASLQSKGFEEAGWTGYQNSFASQADYLFVRQLPRTPQEKIMIELIKSVYGPSGTQRIIKKPSTKDRIFSRMKTIVKQTMQKTSKP
ncbi:hypothetical protein [Gloeobacter kilaueensis]|uniref:Uncharacterized protein n=1 Tax=Gloeobacter kilaueensis (strain ATCC BAA-2537 / CCAP 1431/1 / ULC 316 / JS1) TaxID=1183438 RepID=U5QJM8_GLOK1|nr:hypothetical protein [Gloeobacter kilaueensis]AGY57855.1 hypothetical protein GKIL_1609 [Gloeobacter kilaueensis JS1]